MRAKSAMPHKINNLEAQIEQQQQKSKILDQDRKNFHHQAQQIKQKNLQEIEKLRAQNTHLKNIRDQFIANRKQRRPFTAHDQSLGSTNQPNVLLNDENYLRRLLDKERHLTKTKKAALFSLQDKLKEVEQNKLGFIQENPLMRNIRVLENRLDKVMIKYNEAQSIQKTYQEVVKRLREQRVGYDNQLSIVQSSLKGKQKDFQELLLLAHDAAHAKQAAYAQLKRFQQRRITVQDMRVKYINQKKVDINQQTPNLNQQIRNIERRQNSSPKVAQLGNSYQYDDQYQKQQLSDYQQAFRKLKQVTGVIDANQIIQKFKTQGLTTNSLQQLRQSYKYKIQKLKQQKQQIKKQLQNNKLVLERGKDQRRRVDQIQSQTAQVSNQLQRTLLKYKKLSSSYINIKAGIQHLKDKTKFYKRESVEQTTYQTLEQDLKALNQKLRRMYDIVKNDPQYMKRSYKASAHMIQDMINDHDDGSMGGLGGNNSKYNGYDQDQDY